MNDDELRDRLHAMPAPRTTIDVDAVVADARRRRRPKVAGVAALSVAGCLAFLAPVVVPGLAGPDPVTSSMQEQSAEQAPAAPAPGDDSGGVAPDASTMQTPEGATEADEAASGQPVSACDAVPVARLGAGLSLAFADAPQDGTATILLTNGSDATISVRVGDVGIATVDGGLVTAAPTLDVGSTSTGMLVDVAPGATASLDVAIVGEPAPCGTATASEGEPAPVATLAIATGATGVGPVVGDPVSR